MAEIHHLENRHDVIFSAVCTDLDKISTEVIWSKSKPEVEFQNDECLGEFYGMSSQSHLPHCRVLPPGEFNVMIPELRVILHGAATGQIQWHVIPQPRITLQGAATW